MAIQDSINSAIGSVGVAASVAKVTANQKEANKMAALNAGEGYLNDVKAFEARKADNAEAAKLKPSLDVVKEEYRQADDEAGRMAQNEDHINSLVLGAEDNLKNAKTKKDILTAKKALDKAMSDKQAFDKSLQELYDQAEAKKKSMDSLQARFDSIRQTTPGEMDIRQSIINQKGKILDETYKKLGLKIGGAK